MLIYRGYIGMQLGCTRSGFRIIWIIKRSNGRETEPGGVVGDYRDVNSHHASRTLV